MDAGIVKYFDARVSTNYTLDKVNVNPERFVNDASSFLKDTIVELAANKMEVSENETDK